jgi:hypothetical protein
MSPEALSIALARAHRSQLLEPFSYGFTALFDVFDLAEAS